ncbi:2,' 3'-cyclic nucleotide 2'-phosphodiesterase [Neobacillus notoginsengisoli]|uniref:2,' 3'-cyclic nucleotide 2'-phosphodiesterase n=1 Tax=Neobacillus notoginsengisoli TaxID=1578198 RepID=A0A417Z0E1_9BACI|nr:5'-nucleotidase C-terminal domain-containing protein [Neobacillus notoginsengisoli]RHW43496.1 2,' 3'-cyclic nucleotide 2'-phosphodiesterase [Neobacillus notoginsengisoli]
MSFFRKKVLAASMSISLLMTGMVGSSVSANVQKVPPGLAKKENVKVQLLSVNDLHGKINVSERFDNDPNTYGNAAYLATYLRDREQTNENTLIVHSGDMVGGSPPVSALFQDEPTVEVMESIGFDVGTLGNHEFDEGVDELLRLTYGGYHPNGTANYDGIDFPMVAANVVYKDSGELVLPPYYIKNVKGQKIGFIGVTTTETPNMVVAKGITNVEFTDEAAAINKYVPELAKRGVEAIVVLAHVPGSQAGESATGEIAKLATEINDKVDIIIAAHNHQKVNAVVDNKLIVQAGEYGKAFADIDFEIDPVTGDIVKKEAEIVDVIQQGVTPDPEVSAILEKYTIAIAPKLNEVIGQAANSMQGGYITKEYFGDNALGNLIADGMNAAMGSDFAMMNGGGIRASLDAGEITWEELYNIQPFGNTLVTIEVQGSEMDEIVNAQISSYGPDASIGGFHYKWDSTTGKVTEITLADGTPIDQNATYTLTVNNYMYDHYSDKYKLRAYGENPVHGPDDLQATVDFVKSFTSSINYEAEGRIINISAAQ